ncbi:MULTISPECIES: TIGR02678 family protein [unclassified Pseudactinotalea]|uniref:TIGR02678 family protein n=1 Tax=unclassified Pseudactinotalea TaxID=2649176 RepID=UPI00128CA857|nr:MULTISPECIES: TIGR02678 family protein [unclassified Pseudactinotalea]MPV50649.1 TIGR02678 family protein [Pseudactinotalea sp. HY160]QGH69763.1 TIGR02678 family protein [Pseudactinotalea sp. HY158]
MSPASPIDLAPTISGALEARESEERVRAVRALLARPVLQAQADGELFRLVRRHADALRAWFDRETGWRLLVESQTVRLLTAHVPHGPTAIAIAERHPARARKGDPPFTRRRYVLLCLALAVLERSDPQISLGRLAENIVLAAHRPGLDDVVFTLTGREERSDLVAAIRLLLAYGVLQRVAGDEESYVSAAGDALYDVDRRVLATMLSTTHGPGLVAATAGPGRGIDELEAALHEAPPAYTEEETHRRLRHAVSRRLLCDPVVYYDELPADERAYLVSQRVQLTRRLAEATGLVPELRGEGIALVDPDDQLTDVRMPEQGTDGHATLLLAERLAAGGATDVAGLRRQVRRLAGEHAAYWRKTAQEPGAENALVAAALDRLVGLGLVRLEGEGSGAVVHPLPALRRFTMTAPTITARRAR